MMYKAINLTDKEFNWDFVKIDSKEEVKENEELLCLSDCEFALSFINNINFEEGDVVLMKEGEAIVYIDENMDDIPCFII